MANSKDKVLPAVTAVAAVAASAHFLWPVVNKLATKLYLQWKLNTSSTDEELGKRSVSGLYYHPVKSLRAVSTDSIVIDEKGFVGDRRIMVVYPLPLPAWKDAFGPEESTHRFLTQRQCPSLARIVATIENDQLSLQYSSGSVGTKVTVSLTPQDPISRKVGIWGDQVLVHDLGDEVATFFQSIVDKDEETSAVGDMYKGVRLVIHSGSDRRTDARFTPAVASSWLGRTPPVSLTDGFPILIACQASLDELNRRLQERGETPVEMSRFRPNLVIQGTEAFEEDNWKYIAIGKQIFSVVKACPRCKQSCTDQETGTVHSEPVATMKTFRALGATDDVFFAQNAMALQSGTIHVGDTVRVLQTGKPLFC
eukprot:Nitzschia sp. Nitz4//scaffold183_size43938//32938//34038//NITZ4_007274-RA/size43938-processed-gene-0.56-mRNA-1//1//CDS//3329539626//8287//frame0